MKTNAFTDETLMPYGKYQGVKMANVPASYLLWLYDNNKALDKIRAYIDDNMQALETEIKYKK